MIFFEGVGVCVPWALGNVMCVELMGTNMPNEHHNTQYRCLICNKESSLSDSRMAVICAGHRRETDDVNIELSVADKDDASAIQQICEYFWDETEVVCFRREFNVLECTNILAKEGDELVGMISLALEGDVGIIVLFNVYPKFQGAGIGKKLLDEAFTRFRSHEAQVVCVATSNDDLPALYLYQRAGFQLYEVAPGEIEAHHHGRLISGFAGLPVRDELRLRKFLA